MMWEMATVFHKDVPLAVAPVWQSLSANYPSLLLNVAGNVTTLIEACA